MPAGGQNIGEHIAQKYGSTPEQSAANRAMIRERAGALGFTMPMTDESRIYNTFDAHRLLHWAEAAGCQKALKDAFSRPISPTAATHRTMMYRSTSPVLLVLMKLRLVRCFSTDVSPKTSARPRHSGGPAGSMRSLRSWSTIGI